MFRIFVSYCHKDDRFVQDLRKFLSTYQVNQQLTIWMDQQIQVGAYWAKSIDDALNSCNVAILFISQDFLTSPYVTRTEIPKLLARVQRREVAIAPIFVSTNTAEDHVFYPEGTQGPADGKKLTDFQGFARHNTPTNTLQHVKDKRKNSVYQDVLKKIAQEIPKIAPPSAITTADPYPRETVTNPHPFDSKSGIRLVALPGGTFTMGSPTTEMGRGNDEGPLRKTTVKPFAIGIKPISQEQYREITGKNPSKHRGVDRPAESVSWYNAANFCNALSEQEGFPQAYEIVGTNVTWIVQSHGYRLPTEAEWEYTSRAGSQSAYFFGDSPRDLKKYAWFGDQLNGPTFVVGQKTASPWGLFDIYGNIWEWCWDWYANEYDLKDVNNPMGPSNGEYRICRGGCLWDPANILRSAQRNRWTPNNTDWFIGFRVCRSLSQSIDGSYVGP